VTDSSPLRIGTYYRMHLLHRLGVDGASGVVVDVGGRDGRWVAGMTGTRILVDLDIVRAEPSVDYVRGSGDAIPLRSTVADSVYSLDVIEHTPDEAAVIDEMLRLLRPGGRLVLTTPSADMRVFPGMLQPWVDRKWGHDRVRGFSASYLEKLLRDRGVEVQVRPLAYRLFRWCYFPLRALWGVPGGIGRAAVRAVAAVDARYAWGGHGALLVEARA
jgi:SAM-dependent methyltransferase